MKIYLLTCLIFLFVNTNGQANQPVTDWGNAKHYAAENAKLSAPVKNEKRIVFMGNSITESWKSFDSAFFSDPAYINRGISGQTTPQMLLRFRPDVIALEPTVVVILAGINDIAQNNGPMALEESFGNIVSMAELARANHIRVVLSSVLPAYDFPWRRGLEPAEKIVKLNAMIEAWCKKNKVVFCDYYSSMVDERKGLATQFTYDGVHPNLAGYKLMEPLVTKAIERALRNP